MFNINMYTQLEFEGPHFLDIIVNVNFKVVNDGIGPYEFWGQKCNDDKDGNEYISHTVLDNKGNDITSKLDKLDGNYTRIIDAMIETRLPEIDSRDC